MKWFKHDSDATTDAKLKKLILKYGAEGYAIYFHCIELICNSVNDNNITFELEHDAEIIADNLKIKGETEKGSIDKVNEIMKYIVNLKLFENNNGIITCYTLAKRLDQSMTSNIKMRNMIKKIKSHDKIMINHDSVMQDKIRIDKNRIEKKRIEKNIKKNTDIEEIYYLYPSVCPIKKTSTNKCKKDKEKIARLLKEKEKGDIIKTINEYIEECESKKIWIKNFSTFLNNFPEKENYDIKNMSVEEVEKLLDEGKIK